MAKSAERENDHTRPRLMFDALKPERVKGPTRFHYDSAGKLHATHNPVPEHRMKRARRILWECKQQPEWQRTQAAYYRHPSLRNVPYRVLKQLAQENESRDV